VYAGGQEKRELEMPSRSSQYHITFTKMVPEKGKGGSVNVPGSKVDFHTVILAKKGGVKEYLENMKARGREKSKTPENSLVPGRELLVGEPRREQNLYQKGGASRALCKSNAKGKGSKTGMETQPKRPKDTVV